MQRRTAWSTALLAALSAPVACAGEFGGVLGASSDNVFRGLSQSQGQASVQADAYAAGSSWFGGLSAETIKRGRDEASGAQLIAYLAYQRLLSADWSGALGVRHYDYPGNPYRGRYDYDELSASLKWRERVLLQLIGSPDTYAATDNHRYGRGAAFAAEITARQPLPHGLSADIGIGYYDLQPEIAASYAYWSAGLARRWDAYELALRYVGTDATARHLFGELAGDRLVASVLWSF